MVRRILVWALIIALASASRAHAQSTFGIPYSAQLKSDPAVGNVQGIQRYGRPLKTDPDQGEGYSYHVYPVAHPTTTLVGATPPPTTVYPTGSGQLGPPTGVGVQFRSGEIRNAEGQSLSELYQEKQQILARLQSGRARPDDQQRLQVIEPQISEMTTQAVLQSGVSGTAPANVLQQSATVVGTPGYGGYGYGAPAAVPFDWTNGIRNYATPVPGTPFTGMPPEFRAAVVSRTGLSLSEAEIFHQPLIQIKMRVVEVDRTDGLTVGSILEYVSTGNNQNSLTSGNTANQGRENFRSLTRFLIPDLITNASTGTGSLINLTTEHVNWLVQALATEMNADVVTAPEMVTLNGQNVEFVAGEKLPFQLGQNVIQGNNNNIQQVFYKHVGTMVSVTPRIVNWGFHGEGQGEAVIVASDVLDWVALIRSMLDSQLAFEIRTIASNGSVSTESIKPTLEKYQNQSIIPYSAKSQILRALNQYSQHDLRFIASLAALDVISDEACSRCQRWKPENCTIDLSVVVRLSEGATISDPDNPELSNVRTESNVRAVANVIQVKSGHGVVMAGLIGEREIDDLAKVPLLGDIPIVGFLFRSKAVSRVKTEVLIFIEAQVLDPDPHVARAESAHDFQLSRAYVEGELLDNPLEAGLYQVGMGSYLPPHTHSEQIFWQRYYRKVRKVHTHISDTFRP